MGELGYQPGKNIKTVLSLVYLFIMAAIIQAYLAPLNSEKIIQNWSLGIIFSFIFAVLFCLPIGIRHTYIKTAFLLLTIFWLSWVLVDWEDLIIYMRHI